MFETSPTCTKLDQALCKTQSMMDAAIRDSSNPFYKSTYADLASVWHACKDALAKNEINVTQWPVTSDDGRLHLVTRIAHAGEWMKAECSIPVSKADAQGYGSAITYLRRFALMAALGIVTEDDDGNAAVYSPPQQSYPPKSTPAPKVMPKAVGSSISSVKRKDIIDESDVFL